MADASLPEARSADLDTGGGVDQVEVMGLLVPASGGGIVVGGFLETGSGSVAVLGIGGGTPHGSVDSGYPVKIGGIANSGVPTAVSVGQRVNSWYGLNGQAAVMLVGSSGSGVGVGSYFDGAAPGNQLSMGGFLYGWNSSTWDRLRNVQGIAAGANTDLGILAVGDGPGFARIPAQQSAAATGALAAVSVKGGGSASFQISGTFTGVTAQVEGTLDDSTWFSVDIVHNVATDVTSAAVFMTASAATGRFLIPDASRYRSLRVNVTAYSTGTMLVDWTVQAAVGKVIAMGDVSNGVTDAGNPFKIGGLANSAAPSAVTDGQRVAARFSQTGALFVVLTNPAGTGTSTMPTQSDAQANAGGLIVTAMNSVFNGTNWDRLRGDVGGGWYQQKPISWGALGHYRVNYRCVLVAAQAANSRIFELRNTAATLIVLTRLQVTWLQTAAHTAAIEDSLDVFKCTSFTAVDTTNTATPTVSRMRTSMAAAPGGAAVRGVTATGLAAGMTGGTLTKDGGSGGQVPQWLLLAQPTAGTVIPIVADLIAAENIGLYPWVFAQNEGFEIENRVLLGAAAGSTVYIDCEWAEVTAY